MLTPSTLGIGLHLEAANIIIHPFLTSCTDCWAASPILWALVDPPAFITNSTSFITSIRCVGSPGTATMSASKPGARRPRS
jgi:hypothetical protein